MRETAQPHRSYIADAYSALIETEYLTSFATHHATGIVQLAKEVTEEFGCFHIQFSRQRRRSGCVECEPL
jgi:hypothetical protein